jgi:hypothetical protein
MYLDILYFETEGVFCICSFTKLLGVYIMENLQEHLFTRKPTSEMEPGPFA